MKIYVRVKAVGKRHPVLEMVPYRMPNYRLTLREILTELVRQEVDRYNAKDAEAQILPFLTAEQIEDQAEAGKVGFGTVYADRKADFETAAANAIRCFEDGLVRVFHNDNELTDLDAVVPVQEGDGFTLIRLTFLAGRMW